MVTTSAPRLTPPRPPLRRGAILALVCGAQFMVVLDIAIVNVALPSLQADLGLEQSDLQWVVITYGLMLGGFLLLGGRAADLLGRRSVLVAGLTLFTVSSLTAGLAGSLAQLVVSRAGQGLGGAMAAPAALSILASTFPEGRERNRALGVFGAVGGSAASFGVMAGGLLTDGPGWEWIFFVNVPIGAALVALILRFIPAGTRAARGRADVLGALTVTAGLMAIVYAINQSVDDGWTAPTTLGSLAAGALLLGLFVLVERSAASPLLPLSMFRRRTLNAANLVAALVFGSFFATIFQASLFMQQVLHYSPLRTGFAYLAIAAVALVVSGGGAPVVVGRLGAGWTLAIGQSCSAVGLLLLARTPVDGSYWADLFPAFVLLGVGIGFSVVAAQIAAFIGIDHAFSGLAGGMVETAREVGGALGTAVVASVAIGRAGDVLASLGGDPGATAAALTEGFRRGSLVAAGFNAASVLAALLVLRRAERAVPSGAVGIEQPWPIDEWAMTDMREINPAAIAQYRASGDVLSGPMEGFPVLPLTTTGRRSGRPHTTPLGFVEHGGRLVVAASAGGAATDPDWYRNLVASPVVIVEVGASTWAGVAEVVVGTERTRLFERLAAALPGMAEYATSAGRAIAVVALSPTEASGG